MARSNAKKRQVVAILGVGLIGGSIGLALRARGAWVVGIGRDRGRLDESKRLGAIDAGETDLVAGVQEADVAVVCTPVDRIARDAIRLAQNGPAGLLVTDVGSTKRAIVEAVEADPLARLSFVGAHPIAGSERQGVAFARGDLFEGRVCLLTPTEQTPRDRLEAARIFWESLGCRMLEVDPTTHDEQLALTSHLPHLVASALASVIPPELLPMAAGAYRDGTRVAGADSALWACIFRENRQPLLQALDAFRLRLDAFEQALQQPDEAALPAWWELGKQNRTAYDPENPGNPVASFGKRV